MALTSDQITAQNFADFYQKILPYLNGGGVGLKLLWENSSPASEFPAQKITLSSADYDLLMVISSISTVESNITSTTVAPKGRSFCVTQAYPASGGARSDRRMYSRVSDTEYNVASAYTAQSSAAASSHAGLLLPQVIYGIKVYNRDVPGKTTLLWRNPNPSSAFAAQNIELANSDYDQLTIICDTYINAKTFVSVITVKGNGAVISYTRYDSGSSPRTRTFTYTDATHLSVGDALVNGATNNSHLIPMYVYGTKL